MQSAKKKSVYRRSLWFERLMAIVALLNLLLVLFDLSYIPWRNFYLRQAPQFTTWYGAHFKGIEPHRTTETYLTTVQQLADQVAATGLQSAPARSLLTTLRSSSADLIDENPFEAAGKSGTLERIKRRMRDRVNEASSKQAFATFWSEAYLSQAGWTNSIDFFNSEIRPLMDTNYYRNIGVNGEFIDRFWQVDIGFIGLFAVEFLARTFYLSRRYRGTSWLDTIIWRWYDLLLLIPFWRWLRVIPVAVRLNQAKLINLNSINNRIVHSIVATFAVELTEMVVLQIIDQIQDLLRRGALRRWLLDPLGGRQYIDLNNINEGEAIAQRFTSVLVYQVLPKAKPDLDALLQHVLIQVLNSSPLYTGLQHLPGASDLSHRLTQQIAAEASQNAYQALLAALEDEVGAKMTQQLVNRLLGTFRTEVQHENTIEEIQTLIIALLDEVKLNYVRQIEQEDWERLQTRTKRLYELTQSSRK
ncbi:hypothetical protein IFO70_02265 [Phormidium tenue FACHB-886]|nr:hypothetical protein [Phormidium tenue FACHB-886]